MPGHHASSATGESAIGDEPQRFAEAYADLRRSLRQHVAHARSTLKSLKVGTVVSHLHPLWGTPSKLVRRAHPLPFSTRSRLLR